MKVFVIELRRRIGAARTFQSTAQCRLKFATIYYEVRQSKYSSSRGSVVEATDLHPANPGSTPADTHISH